ncbi:MAG: response regulator [Lachnospiraceae bacterium]|nr:response regulator [Lachnospiraceae bacterium]
MNEIILEFSAFCIAFFCMVDCLHNRRQLYLPVPKGLIGKLRNRHYSYLSLLVMLMISALLSVAEVSAEQIFHVQNSLLLNILNELYFIFYSFVPFLFALYVMNVTGAGKERSSIFFVAVLTPIIISETLVLTNPLTKLIFYVDESCHYQRGSLLFILYIIGVAYVFFGSFYFFKNRKKLARIDRSATGILILVSIIGIFIQGLWSVSVELFFESVGFLGFMLMLEDRALRERTGKNARLSKGFVAVVAMIFITVISMNISLMYNAGTNQTEKIGAIQIDSIKGDLQETLSDAQSYLLRFAMGMEQLLSEGADLASVEEYIITQKAYYKEVSDGNCFNTYAASGDWTIIPDFDMPSHYHAKERIWYTGAMENGGEIYITEPYIDADTRELCFTLSLLLSDRRTVVSMDYTMTRIQDSIRQMQDNKDQKALIVTSAGSIVGDTDPESLGREFSEVYPEYVDVFERVKASNEHGSFRTKIGNQDTIIFSSETSNGWYLILGVNTTDFYADIYRQMIMLAAIDILMVAVIIVFYMVSMNNQQKAENALAATDKFIRSLSGDLQSPLNDILRFSEESLRGDGNDRTYMREISESGKRLSERLDNLFSYSGLIQSEKSEKTTKAVSDEKKLPVRSRYIRNGIIAILVSALMIGLVLCLGTATKWGDVRIHKEADKYNNELSRWILQKQSILSMFTDVIIADPSVIEDYDQAVKWLDDIGKNYSEISFCYLGNPYNSEHQIIMNNGWVPDADYKVDERQWYIDTKRSGSGSSISAPYFDAQTGLYCITFSKIMYSKEGEFLGIFAIDCYIDKLIDILDDSYSTDGYAFLVDQDGVIINHPNKAYEMTEESSVNIEDTEFAEAYHKGSVFSLKDYNGKTVSCVTQKDDASGFTVFVVQSWWSVYGNIIFMCFVFLLLLVICIVAVARLMNRFISWQQETNEKLVEAAEEAVSAGKAKSRFLAQMSHEIRTPINAVLGMNEMILRESGDDSIREYAGNIQSAGKNLLGLINTILDFSKIDEGKMEIIPVKYSTVDFVSNLINSVSQRAKDKNLYFRTHIDGTLPQTLYGDDLRIAQAANNLLTNAVKYTREGGIDLYVSGVREDDDTLMLGIRVVDTGIGIRKEDQEKLFDSFTRLDETRNRNIEGTGLGMAIVTKLLDMMDSKLNVWSEYGQGSDFSFEVKQTIMDDTAIGNYEERVHEAATRHKEETYLYAPEARILVVDDNEMNLKVIRNLLKLNGIVPEMVESGMQALEKLKENNYDIMLLDHMMPQMDGIETLAKAREDDLIPAGMAVIVLTANAVVGAREQYLAAGFDDYISKPVEVKSLEFTLGKYLPKSIVSYRKKDEKTEDGAGTGISTKTAAGGNAGLQNNEQKNDGQRNETTGGSSDKISAVSGDGKFTESTRDDVMEFMPDDGVMEFTPDDGIMEFAADDGVMEFAAEGGVGSEGGDKPAGKKDRKAMFESLQQIGISTEDGLRYCAGDESFYEEVLSDYAKECESRLSEMEAALASDDIKTYQIKVHALKGVSKTVGAMEIFEKAKALEDAAKQEDAVTVKDGHPTLKKLYEGLAEKIKKEIE